jgi:SAM-dependent methyltransferase
MTLGGGCVIFETLALRLDPAPAALGYSLAMPVIRSLGRALGWIATALYGARAYLLNQPLFTSTILPAIPRPLRWALRRAYLAPVDLIEAAVGRRDTMVPPPSKMFVGSVDDFKSSGELLVRRLIEVAGLTTESTVLDVGCGIGRLAVALTTHLSPEGRYEGLDIVPSGIAWCAANVTPRYPNFRFTLADIVNREYNPDGHIAATEYRLPYPDATFDLVVLTSVFTHMLASEQEHYVDEIARVLKPGGYCFATYLLLNPESRHLTAAGSSDTRFKHSLGPCAVVDLRVPELSVGYDQDYVRDVYEQRGLSTDGGIFYGSWCGRERSPRASGLSQDLVLGVRRRSPPTAVC